MDIELVGQNEGRCVTEVVDEETLQDIVREYGKIDIMKYMIEVKQMASIERGRIHLILKDKDYFL